MQNPAIRLIVLILLVAFTTAGNFTPSFGQDNQERRAIRRVKRPVFSEKDGNEIYFDNIFEEGLTGPRPEKTESLKSKTTVASAAENSTLPNWSQYVTREAVEDEIKSIQSHLQSQLTTRGRFNSQFADIRQQFNMLSMLFGIVHEYNQDIRWKQNAHGAQIAFADVADKTQAPSESAFAISVQRNEDLTELIRGESVAFESTPPTALDWPAVIDRQPIMVRLEQSLETALKPATSNSNEFEKNLDSLSQQTNIVSALAQVLVQDSMEDADDDGYVAFSRALGVGASDLLKAIETRDFELASQSVNVIEQSCNDCHGEWR